MLKLQAVIATLVVVFGFGYLLIMHSQGNALFNELHDDTNQTLSDIEYVATQIYPLRELLAEISSMTRHFHDRFELVATDPDADSRSIAPLTETLESLSKRLDSFDALLDWTQYMALKESLGIMIGIGRELDETSQSYLILQLFLDTNTPLNEIEQTTLSIRSTLKQSADALTTNILKRKNQVESQLVNYNDYTRFSFYLLAFSGILLVLLAIGSRMIFLHNLRKRLELLSGFAHDIASERYRAAPFSTRDPVGLLGVHLWIMGRRVRAALKQARQEQSRADHALAKIEELAYFDPLTGLQNRRRFMLRLEEILQVENMREHHPVLIYFDLDNFKEINDSLGHEAGDQLLVAIAERLHPNVRQHDSFGRLGGDEFALLALDQTDRGMRLAERLKLAFSSPFKIAGYEVFSSISMGIVVMDQPDKHPMEVLKEADLAMYRAKAAGRANYIHFSPEMRDEAEQSMELSIELRRALEEQQFLLHFQPQFSIDGSRLLGAEALIRWQHPTHGLIFPGAFMGVAESSGLIVPIGDWVIIEGCHAARRIADAGLDVRIGINISGRQFYRGDLNEQITKALAVSGADPSLIELEITESMLLQDIDEAIRLLRQLKSLEIRIALDDFGTGFSSLNYLTRLPINTVKIDRGFVSEMLAHPKDKAVIEAIIALGHRLGLSVVAEGIETEAQARFLAELECDIAQGFLYGRPAEIEVLLKRPQKQTNGALCSLELHRQRQRESAISVDSKVPGQY